MSLQKYAAWLLKTGSPARASDWHLAGGLGTLKANRAAIDEEMNRQMELRQTRHRNRQRPRDWCVEQEQFATAKNEFFIAWKGGKCDWAIAGVRVAAIKVVHTDWDRYSKTWHRQYGPARPTSNYIECSRWTGRRIERKSYPQPSSDHFRTRAIAAVADFLRLPRHDDKKALRIHPSVALRRARRLPKFSYVVHERRLAGETIGYVASCKGTHFHADSIENACHGLRQKFVKARHRRIYGSRAKAAGFDFTKSLGAILRGLGFCAEGTADALHMLGLRDGRYDLSELRSLLGSMDERAMRSVAAKYPNESRLILAEIKKLDLPDYFHMSIRDAMQAIMGDNV
jgi:hypothetical protein